MGTNFTNGQLRFVEPISNPSLEIERTYAGILKERLDEYGVDNLVDSEILCLLTGISVETLRTAIEDFGMNDLIKFIDALNLSKAERRKIELLNTYHKRVLSSGYKTRTVLGTSAAVGTYAITLFSDKVYESFYLLCLDSQNRLIKAIEVHRGTINEAPVYPRLIVEEALRHKANAVILSHNHPGGSLVASGPDRAVTSRIKAALDPISISVIDHIIVSEGRYMSFAETGLL